MVKHAVMSTYVKSWQLKKDDNTRVIFPRQSYNVLVIFSKLKLVYWKLFLLNHA